MLHHPPDAPTASPAHRRGPPGAPSPARPRLCGAAVLGLLFALGLGACTGGPALSADALEDRLPLLEARAADAPDDADALLDLGRAYVRLGLYGRARAPLVRAERLDPDGTEAYALLGLLEEGLGHRAEALARYQDAPPTVAADARLGPWIAGRAAWLRREIARTDVEAALDAETYPDEATEAVAVFPFAVADGANGDGLGRALAALTGNALAAAGLRVVDGDRVDALLNELAVDPAALDADRARRLGQLLRSRHVLVGEATVDGDTLRAAVTLWAVDQDAPRSQVTQAVAVGDVASILPLVAERTAQALGAPPPSAEALPRPAPDALRRLGEGLRAESAGRPVEAAARYAEAARLDPTFAAASARRQQAERLALAAGPVPEALDRLASLAPPPAGVADLTRRRLAALNATLGGHAVPGEEARAPRADSRARPRPTTPFPVPPPPPTGGTSGPPGNRP